MRTLLMTDERYIYCTVITVLLYSMNSSREEGMKRICEADLYLLSI